MKKTLTRRLQLQSFTLRSLTTADLAAPRGGVVPFVSDKSQCASCSDPPSECLCP